MKFVPKKVSCKILNDNHHQSYYLSVFRTQALSLLPDQPPSPRQKKPPRDVGAAILLLLLGLVIHLQQPLLAGRLLLFTKCKRRDQETSSSMSRQ